MPDMIGFPGRLSSGTVARMSYVLEQVSIPADRSRIDVGNPVEVKWWSRLLGCSREQLLDAVARVGDSAAVVERWLDSWLGLGWAPQGA